MASPPVVPRPDVEPLQAAAASFEVATPAAAHGLTLRPVSPLLHFSRRLDVLAWSPRRVAL